MNMKESSSIPKWRQTLRKVAISPFLALIWFYRTCIGPYIPKTCRFEPSCSTYALEAFRTQKAVEKIAALENLSVSDEEMNAAFEKICADNNMRAEDLQPYFDNGFITVVQQQLLREKATDLVRRAARITQ